MFVRTQLLLDQAAAYEKAGQWQNAADVCETLFQEGWKHGRVNDVLEAILRLGLLFGTHGRTAMAKEYFELALTISEKVGDDPHAARSLNSLGVQHQRSGDIETAEALYQQAKLVAARGDDSRTLGDVEVNLGIIANIRGELRTALMHYGSALAEYKKVAHHHRIARVLNNLGMLYIDLQDYEQAAATLDQALATCRAIDDIHVEGIVLTNRTELFLALGDLEEARRCCDDAYEIASRLSDGQLKADVLKSYGVIYRGTNKPHLAESHLREAISLAAHLNYPLVEADANRELALTLRRQDRNREALQALNRAHVLFSLLQAKQEQADIDKRFRQLEDDFLSIVAKWGESIEAKDKYTSGHCERVATYSCEIARAAGMSELDITWFRMGAFLHDVGKTVVPEAVLNKPGQLTPEERAVMEHHTVAGDQMLASIEFPWDIRAVVRSHHERWDGAGYPDRLSGEDIPYAARILHIADVFDALTTTRSYRDPLSPDDALALMESDHRSFDPELFILFKKLLPVLARSVPDA